MKVGVVKETFPGEKRVSLVPSVLPKLDKAGLNVVVEKGAGYDAGFPDEAYHPRARVSSIPAPRSSANATWWPRCGLSEPTPKPEPPTSGCSSAGRS